MAIICLQDVFNFYSYCIVKYSAQNCLNAVFNYHVKYSYAVKQGEMDDDMVIVNLTMLNINAICNVLFFIYIPIMNAAFDESVDESNVEARYIERSLTFY
jgi:hypothetical protein